MGLPMMPLLSDIRNLIIFLLIIATLGLYGWGHHGWHQYDTAMENVTLLQAQVKQLTDNLNDIKQSSDKILKARTQDEKDYRAGYLFEKKEIENAHDPDETLGCEKATQDAIAKALKIRDSA